MTRSGPIFILNGPNLDRLGSREPEIYGTRTIKELERTCWLQTDSIGFDMTFEQSNTESVLVDLIGEAGRSGAGLVINPGAFAYSSSAIVDALRSIDRPVVEVHLANIHAGKESWRAKSLVSPVVTGVICGMGFEGYGAAIRWIGRKLGNAIGHS